MATSEVIYVGQLRTHAIHIQSGATLLTDAPKDNQGEGTHFSPTDLLATSLASCMLTIMGIAARTHALDLAEVKATVTKHMASNPRKVSKVEVKICVNGNLSVKDQMLLERSARTCPVALSLHPELVQEVQFTFER